VARDDDATEEEAHAHKVQLLELFLEDKVEGNCCDEGRQRVEVHCETIVETGP